MQVSASAHGIYTEKQCVASRPSSAGPREKANTEAATPEVSFRRRKEFHPLHSIKSNHREKALKTSHPPRTLSGKDDEIHCVFLKPLPIEDMCHRSYQNRKLPVCFIGSYSTFCIRIRNEMSEERFPGRISSSVEVNVPATLFRCQSDVTSDPPGIPASTGVAP